MATEAPFAWDDPLGLDDQLSEEERAVRDAAYDYCQSSLQPRIVLAAARALRPSGIAAFE